MGVCGGKDGTGWVRYLPTRRVLPWREICRDSVATVAMREGDAQLYVVAFPPNNVWELSDVNILLCDYGSKSCKLFGLRVMT